MCKINCKYVWLPNVHREKYAHINVLRVQVHLYQSSDCRHSPVLYAVLVQHFAVSVAADDTIMASDSPVSI